MVKVKRTKKEKKKNRKRTTHPPPSPKATKHTLVVNILFKKVNI
jgi:hypothetical protein